MSGAEWTTLTIGAIGAVGAVILQGLQMYFSYKRIGKVETKLDDNTKLTKDAVTAATNGTIAAAKANVAAVQVAETIHEKLNGGVEAAIRPLKESLAEHAAQDEANMRELRGALTELRGQLRSLPGQQTR